MKNIKKILVKIIGKISSIKKITLLSPRNANKFSPLVVVLLLGGFILINGVLIFAPSLRFDFSPNRVYTLSQSSKKIIKSLPVNTTFDIYASSNLPSRLMPIQSDVLTFLREYERYSNGKIQIKLHDPKSDTKAQETVSTEGIPPLQFSEVDNNQYKVTASYFGMIISSGKNKQVIPQLIQTENLEYNVTLSLYKIAIKKLPTLQLVDFPQTSTGTDDFSMLREVLNNQFETNMVTSTDYKNTLKKSKKTDVYIVIVGGDQKYSTSQKKLFSDILSRGNNLIVLINTLSVDGGLTSATVAGHGLFNIFTPYGITIQKNLILSQRAPTLTFNTSQGYLLLKYPPWIKTNSFAKDRSEFNNVQELVFPWASSLKVDGSKNVTSLAFSDKDAWSITKTFAISPTITFGPSKISPRGPFVMVAESTQKNNAHLLVIPSARFAQNEFLARGSSNIEFLLNSISQYSSSGDLSGIRSRSVDIKSLKSIDAQYKDMIKYATMLVLPLLFVLFGLYRIIKRG